MDSDALPPLHISLGNDCAVAEILRDRGLRPAAFPFDWAVTYGGVARLFGAPDALTQWCAVDGAGYNAAHGTLHLHTPFPYALPTMARRFERLRAVLADPAQRVVLIRRSHTLHHHFERAEALVDELADARALANGLKAAFPAKAAAGGFRLLLLLACDMCHPKLEPGADPGGVLEVHNLTRGPSSTFAEKYPSKTYKDALQARLTELGVAGPPPAQAPGPEQGPYALEQ